MPGTPTEPRVALVEDDPDLLALAEVLLEPAVVVARLRTAAEALAYDGWDEVDVAVVDWLLPGGGGGAVVQHLRDRHPRVLRVVQSAIYPAPAGVPDGIADLWLDKLEVERLPERVLELFERHERARRARGRGVANAAAGAAIRVAAVDDHELFRDILDAVVTDAGMEFVGEASTVASVPGLLEADPHVLVVDYHLPDGTGIDVARVVERVRPDVRVLLLTADTTRAVLAEAVRGGCAGVVYKHAGIRAITDAITTVAQGERAYAHELFAASAAPAQPELTPRERQVLELLAEGGSVERIAGELDLSGHTVRNYLRALMRKAGVHSRAELVAWAFRVADADGRPAKP